METRDISILTQVAFKGAIEAVGDQLGTDQGNLVFINTLGFLTDALLAEVQQRTGSAAVKAAPPAQPPMQRTVQQAQQMIEEEFPGTIEEPEHTVEIIRTNDGAPFGDTPAWLIKAAQAKGVTKVFDNRNRLSQNPKLPWFKSPKDQGEVAFWPPRGTKG
ncbi:MAG: hypothetical protein ACO3O7_05710 [Ilumatobacteraceae bacterium]